MTPTTVLATGAALSYDVQVERWIQFVDGDTDMDDDFRDKLVDRLMAKQVEQFNNLLPSGCRWNPHTSEIVGPVDADLTTLDQAGRGHREDHLEDVMETIAEAVAERAEDIENSLRSQ